MTKFQYKRHVETVHGANIGEENSGKFECEDCHKEYKNLDTLRQHKKAKKHMEYSKDAVDEIDHEELVKYKSQKKVTQPQLDRHMKAVHGDKIKEEINETVIRLSF